MRVFINYTHDSVEHKAKVCQFADTLRLQGIETVIDQYEMPQGPADGWPRWMQRQLQDADHIVCVCSETYGKRIDGREEPEKGKGAAWEGNILYNILYDDKARTSKVVPVLFDDEPDGSIPLVLKGMQHYRLPRAMEGLYRHLTDQPATPPPPPDVAPEMTVLPAPEAPELPDAWANLGAPVTTSGEDVPPT